MASLFTPPSPILVAGSVLWDIVGRSDRHMKQGHDVPGRIIRIPGGVGMNIAMALRQHDVPVRLLSALGDDGAGRELLQEATLRGMDASLLHISPDHPTDQYMAVEGANGLIAAIADCHSLERMSDEVLAPLRDGRVSSAAAPYEGILVCEGNLPAEALAALAHDAALVAADVRLAPASPGKADRLRPFMGHNRATFYVNLIEARILLDTKVPTAPEAASQLVAGGLHRAVVTDGANMAAIAMADEVLTGLPPAVDVRRVTGAGDVFMASHIAAELRGDMGQIALDFALAATADYISTEAPL
ncbi:MAG: PfkB family carbohydrate kinase [Pseudomonadota bacterium]